MEPPVFIVGTGRCGSTMMSSIVRLHPRLLSLSEFFSALAARAFTMRRPDGEEFWRLLTTLSPVAALTLVNDPEMEEVLYEFGADARFTPGNVPPILMTALPHLTRDYEALFDELAPVVRSQPRAPLGQHYRNMFEWLCQRYDRMRVVERSGSSLLAVPALARLFPEAKFVHLCRDGRDAAISMRRHSYFKVHLHIARFIQHLGLDPFQPPLLYGSSYFYPCAESLVGRLLPIRRWIAKPRGLAKFGEHWSRTIVSGTKFLSALPDESVLTLRYEDILQKPREELKRFMDFLGPEYADEGWLNDVSQIPRPPKSDWRALPEDEQQRLNAVCQPGLAALGYT